MKKICLLTLFVLFFYTDIYAGTTDFSLSDSSLEVSNELINFNVDTNRLRVTHLAPINNKTDLEVGFRLLQQDSGFSSSDGQSLSAGFHIRDKNVHVGFRGTLSEIDIDFGFELDLHVYEFDMGFSSENTIYNARIARGTIKDPDGEEFTSSITSFSARHFVADNFLIGAQFTPIDGGLRAYTLMGQVLLSPNLGLTLSHTSIKDTEFPENDATEITLGLNLLLDTTTKSYKSNILSGRVIWEPEYFKSSP